MIHPTGFNCHESGWLVRERCEGAGIGWAIWEDPVNMSLFDSAAGTWNAPLVDALLPP